MSRPDRRKEEQEVSRYMQEIRDIGKAGFNRRELLKMGLVAGGSGLLAMYGMRNFKPYWAHAESLSMISPPNTPFVDPLYIPPALQETVLNPAPTKGSNPTPSGNKKELNLGAGMVSPQGYTEAVRPDHQRWEEFLPVKQYESVEMCVAWDFYPTKDGVPPTIIWTFVDATNGNYAPLRLNAHYGQPVVHRVHNCLPPLPAGSHYSSDYETDNRGFGINQTSTHLHNGHTGSESDGGPTHFYDSGRFKDFHYPNVRAGFASTHPTSSLNGRTVPGDVRETMSFLWFHDHRMDFTAANVYKMLASFYPLFSDDINLDTGDETTGLRLPSGEYDIPLILMDKVFDPSSGEMFFDGFNIDGILGDKYTVNGKIQPYLEVKRRKYRFRLLDGGPSRTYEVFLSNGQPFFLISNDGNLLPQTLTQSSIRFTVAERRDVIVDFSKAKAGDKIYLQNRLEQVNGRGPTGRIIAPTNMLEFRVTGDATDNSRIPGKLLDLPVRRTTSQSRSWNLGRSNGMWVINGRPFDPGVISAFPKQNTAEQWTLTTGNGWLHPLHIHFEEFQLLSRNGRPVPIDEVARKDVVRMGQNAVGRVNGTEAQLFMQFRDFLGDYPMHCHNVVHEDHAMMVRWQIVP